MGQSVIVSNGQNITPLAPSITHDTVMIGSDRRMLGGNMRRVYRAVKEVISYTHDDLSEAEKGTWETAHPFNTSYTHVDELGVSRTVITTQRSFAVNRMTGNSSYRYSAQITVEEV
jgi:hypothetical protein